MLALRNRYFVGTLQGQHVFRRPLIMVYPHSQVHNHMSPSISTLQFYSLRRTSMSLLKVVIFNSKIKKFTNKILWFAPWCKHVRGNHILALRNQMFLNYSFQEQCLNSVQPKLQKWFTTLTYICTYNLLELFCVEVDRGIANFEQYILILQIKAVRIILNLIILNRNKILTV